jgi:peptide/nickel transport system permease protein
MADGHAALVAMEEPSTTVWHRPRLRVVPTVIIAVLAIIVLASVLAPLVAPYDPSALSPDRFAGPGLAHLLGTDDLGRDLLSRLLYSGRTTLGISCGAAVVSCVLGLVWGALAAFSRGFTDEVAMRVADTIMAIPSLLLALVLVAAFGSSPLKLSLMIGVLLTPAVARMMRSLMLSERVADYYTAAIAYGATRRRLLLTEVFPNVWPSLAVQGAITVAQAIILEASLSFIGLGVQDPEYSWGLLVRYGYNTLSRSLWYPFFPALAILLTIWLLNSLTDQLGQRRSGAR